MLLFSILSFFTTYLSWRLSSENNRIILYLNIIIVVHEILYLFTTLWTIKWLLPQCVILSICTLGYVLPTHSLRRFRWHEKLSNVRLSQSLWKPKGNIVSCVMKLTGCHSEHLRPYISRSLQIIRNFDKT